MPGTNPRPIAEGRLMITPDGPVLRYVDERGALQEIRLGAVDFPLAILHAMRRLRWLSWVIA